MRNNFVIAHYCLICSEKRKKNKSLIKHFLTQCSEMLRKTAFSRCGHLFLAVILCRTKILIILLFYQTAYFIIKIGKLNNLGPRFCVFIRQLILY